MSLVSATNAYQAARTHLDAVSDPATRPDITGMRLPEARAALLHWEQAVADARSELARAQAAHLSAQMSHGVQLRAARA